jgi:hypothetical protein
MTEVETAADTPIELNAEEITCVAGGNSGLIWSGGG